MNLFRNWATSDFQQQAAEFCLLARESYGLELDYTPATLTELDDLIEGQFGPRSADDNATLIVAMGCYVGEVLIHSHGGHWHAQEEFFHSPSVVMEGKLQTRTYPLSRVWKRFEYGSEHSLAVYYREVGDLLARL